MKKEWDNRYKYIWLLLDMLVLYKTKLYKGGKKEQQFWQFESHKC